MVSNNIIEKDVVKVEVMLHEEIFENDVHLADCDPGNTYGTYTGI